MFKIVEIYLDLEKGDIISTSESPSGKHGNGKSYTEPNGAL